MDNPAYRASAIVRATGVPRRRLKDWCEQRHVAGADSATRGTGNHRRFSLRSAHKIGLAHALTQCGVTPRAAIAVAGEFSQRGLFAQGKTWLLAVSGGKARVVNASPTSTLSDILDNAGTGERADAAAVVNCNAIIDRVNARLKIQQPNNRSPIADFEYKQK